MEKYIKYRTIVTPVSGAVSWNTPKLTGKVVSVHVLPTTSTNEYSLSIVDADGSCLYNSPKPQQGELSASYDHEIFCGEIITCTISDATIDEAITVIIRIQAGQGNR